MTFQEIIAPDINVIPDFENEKALLIRHSSKGNDIDLLYKSGYLNYYQQIQNGNIFDGKNYLFVFIADFSTSARFVGLYKVVGKKNINEFSWDESCPCEKFNLTPETICYQIEKCDVLSTYENRVLIEWGKDTINWIKKYRDAKNIIEILANGYVKEFIDYSDVIISYAELKEIINNPYANREWHIRLSALSGVYLITDLKTGLQYVGSAYGERGILGRWETYSKDWTGNNKELKKLLTEGNDYSKYFQYSILEVMSKKTSSKQVIERESLWKMKLGSKAFGLNSN